MLKFNGAASKETRTFSVPANNPDGTSGKYKAYGCNNSTQYSNQSTRATELLAGDFTKTS